MLESPSLWSSRRWRIAALLGIGVIVNFFDRVNLLVAITPLNSEYGLSAVAIGYLLACGPTDLAGHDSARVRQTILVRSGARFGGSRCPAHQQSSGNFSPKNEFLNLLALRQW